MCIRKKISSIKCTYQYIFFGIWIIKLKFTLVVLRVMWQSVKFILILSSWHCKCRKILTVMISNAYWCKYNYVISFIQSLSIWFQWISWWKVMVAEALDIARETYFAIVLDRSHAGPVIIGSKHGGMDIEETAATDPDSIIKVKNLYCLMQLFFRNNNHGIKRQERKFKSTWILLFKFCEHDIQYTGWCAVF